MKLLGIETSCDETSAAIVEADKNKIFLRSNSIASSMPLHIATGGIIPENAAREQVKYILPVIKDSFQKAAISIDEIDAIAVTYGPGLIGSLLVGVETTKTLAFVLQKPLIPINHMIGHIYANFINEKAQKDITFPLVALVVSGGHTDLLLMKKHGDFTLLGGTRDDAAGEAFDKIGRLLGLPYPAGPIIEKLAQEGNPKHFRFPRPLLHEDTYEFSFSGLKTAVLREVQKIKQLDEQLKKDIARATQDAIIDVLVKKTFRAAKEYNVKSILLSGGVSANQTLTDAFKKRSEEVGVSVFAPSKVLCTDNAAMIAAAAAYNFKPVAWETITANPELYFD